MSTLNINDIKKHADVIASCGTKVGTVDHLEGENQLKLGEFKHEVRQFEKSYDNQQAEQISLMV